MRVHMCGKGFRGWGMGEGGAYKVLERGLWTGEVGKLKKGG